MTDGDWIGLRPGRRADAGAIAEMASLASGGLASHLWAKVAAPGEPPSAVGARRAARDEGSFSWRNAVMAELDGRVAGGMICYRLDEEPVPLEDLPPIAVPLQRLEIRARGTIHVNVLATFRGFVRRGVARRLLDHAAERAGAAGTSLIVADVNLAALALYRQAGFAERARAPMVKEDWPGAGTDWILMTRVP